MLWSRVPSALVLAILVSACAEIAAAQEVGSGATAAAPDLQKFLQMRSFLSRRNEQHYRLAVAHGIDEARYVSIGGIEQYISIRGEDRDNPVILFLHGGPGDATNPWGYLAFRSWLRHFTVVQWDQRGAGRTLRRSGPDRSNRHRRAHDAGWRRAGRLPAQVADATRNYAVAYEYLLRKARALEDRIAIEELSAIGPPPYPDYRGWGVQRKWSNLFEHADLFIAGMVGAALSAPGYTLADFNDWNAGQALSGEQLIPQTAKLDGKALGGQFALPVVVIQGAEDFTTPTSLAGTFVASIRAPRKQFVTIRNAGHFAVFMRSDEFLRELVTHVLPLTKH